MATSLATLRPLFADECSEALGLRWTHFLSLLPHRLETWRDLLARPA